MADTAFSRIYYGAEKDESGYITKQLFVDVGDTVDQGTLGVDDDTYQDLKDEGVIREYDYPPVEGDQTPAQYWQAQALAAGEAAQQGEPPVTPPEPASASEGKKSAVGGKSSGSTSS